jgi:hypothetical protein
MRPIAEYYEDRLRLSEHQFTERHKSPVLLHRQKDGEAQSANYKTVLRPPTTLVNAVRLSQGLPSLGLAAGAHKDANELVAYPLSKRPGAPFPERITVGRTRNMDLCLPLPQVSKFHAYFTLCDGATRFLLTDNGSTNGTFVSGKRLAPEQPMEIRNGALIQFGDFQALFFTPASLYGLLSP